MNYSKPTILVLGGGIGGVYTARELARKIGNEDGVVRADILVFEREKQSLYSPSLTWLMVGKRKPYDVTREMKDIANNGIQVIEGEIENIDPVAKTVTSGGKVYQGNYMIISLGVEQDQTGNSLPAAHNFYSVDGATSFFDQLKSFDGNRITILVKSLPYKSPVAPYESAMLIDNYLREENRRDDVEISIYTPEDRPMPFADEKIIARVTELMSLKNIRYYPNHQFVREEGGKLILNKDNDESVTVDAGLIAFTPKHTAPRILAEAGLLGDSGWIEPDAATLETKFENVYAIGDVIDIPIDATHSLPKAGIFARHQAEVVAHNIMRKIADKAPDKTFEFKGSYILDQGDKADKISGDFRSDAGQSNYSGVLRHWEKVLSEKMWFLNNF